MSVTSLGPLGEGFDRGYWARPIGWSGCGGEFDPMENCFNHAMGGLAALMLTRDRKFGPLRPVANIESSRKDTR